MENLPAKIALGVFIGINAAVLLWLLVHNPRQELRKRLPGLDDSPKQEETGPVKIEGELTQLEGEPGKTSDRWSQFLNDTRDGIAHNAKDLPRSWPDNGPQVLWSLDVGQGYASTAVANGRAYMIDYDEEREGDLIRCLSLKTGEDIWQYYYPSKIKRNHGMSRTVPAVTSNYLVTIGPEAHVTCLDAKTGEFSWMLNLKAEYGTEVPQWYAGQCPLIADKDEVVLAPAGNEVLMMKVDCATGDVLWETPNEPGWEMTHSSIVPMKFNDRKIYIYCASDGVVGVDAESGELLWTTDKWRIRIATVPSPVIVGNQRIFLTGGYNSGCMMLKLTEQDGEISVEEEFTLDAQTFASEQQTPILYENHLYAVRPDGQLACLDTDGDLQWTSGDQTDFGLGPLLIADGLIYVLSDQGRLTLAEATPDDYNQLAQAQILDGHEAWGPMSLVDGKLILRDTTQMMCLDLQDN